MPQYPRIPDPRPPAADETAGQYGAYLLAHVIAHGPATLSRAQLELAAYAGARASATPGYSPVVYARLSLTRHTLAATIARQAVPAPVDVPAGHAPGAPPLGPMAPLSPAPVTRPPSGQYADVPAAPGPDARDLAAVRDAIAF